MTILCHIIRIVLTLLVQCLVMTMCRVTTERHRAEVRRAISDDRLAAIAGRFVFLILCVFGELFVNLHVVSVES